MNKFLERLQSGKTLVADGATGTNLHKMGLQPGIAPEDLVLDQPELILKLEIRLCSGRVRHPADMHLWRNAPADEGLEICPAGDRGQYPRRRTGPQGCLQTEAESWSAGSIGPTGLLMKPYGPLSPDEACAAFTEQVQGLVAGGVDLLVIETMFAFDEADAAFKAARSVTDLPIVVSFSYDRGVRTMMGVKPARDDQTLQRDGRGAGGGQLRHLAGKHGKGGAGICCCRAGFPAVDQAQCRPAAHAGWEHGLRCDPRADGRICQEICGTGGARGGRLLWKYAGTHRCDCQIGQIRP